jgi:hypothetical protein
MATNYLNLLIGTSCPRELAAVIADNTGVIRPDGFKAWDVDAQGDFVQDATYGGSIELTKASTAVGQPAQTGVSAAGSDLAGATQLTRVSSNVTVAAAGTGVKLWDAPLGSELTVRNEASVYSPLNVYPPTASISINSRSNGTPYVLGYGESGKFTKVSSVLWIAQVGINQEVSNGVTAAGTIITNATDLANPINNVTTAATGSGVQLYEAAIGTRIMVRNGGNGSCLVYPPTDSGTINELSAGVGFMLPARSVATFSKLTATVWIAELGLVQGVENGITATGSGAGDAFALSRFVNQISGGAGTTGAILPAATTVPAGVPIWIRNDSGSNKIIYPPSGGTLNGGASVTLATGGGIACIRYTSTVWYTF